MSMIRDVIVAIADIFKHGPALARRSWSALLTLEKWIRARVLRRKVLIYTLAGVVIASVLGIFAYNIIQLMVYPVPVRSASSKDKYALVVLPVTETTKTTRQAFGFESQDLVQMAGNPSWVLRLVPEGPTVNDTIATLKKLLSDPANALVIGHIDSTTAAECLRSVYRGTDGESVPLILFSTTHPDLTKCSDPTQAHVLRIPLADDRIADLAAHFIRGMGGYERLILVLDSSNPLYADYFANRLLRQSGTEKPLPIMDVISVRIMGEGFSLTRAGSIRPSDLLNTIVVFVGMESAACVFLRRIREDYPDLLDGRLVFSDGAVGDAFFGTCADVLKTRPNGSVFVTGSFYSKDQLHSAPTFGVHVRAASHLAATLFSEAALLPGGVSRSTVRQAMRKTMGRKIRAHKEIEFSAIGDNVSPDWFTVIQISVRDGKTLYRARNE